MLYQYTNVAAKVFNLAPHKDFTIESENIFTTIVGQNGTGKSRLLKGIIENSFMSEKSILNDYPFTNLNVERSYDFSNRIALSTSPFDKFPSSNIEKKYYKNYTYLGLKDLGNANLSKAYLSKVITSLILSLLDDSKRFGKLNDILNYLGYEGFMNLSFEINKEWRDTISLFNKFKLEKYTSPELAFKSILEETPKQKLYKNFYDDNGEQRYEGAVGYAIKLLKKMKEESYPRVYVPNLLLENSSFQIIEVSEITIKDIWFMLEFDILKLKDVFLKKITQDKHSIAFKINEASSGEQSVIMSMLGIASKIENGSLICIDEPEVCLHPAWQEKYIKFLMNTFKDYTGCHFIIATHSPQITSKLEDKNCYVMSMDDRKLVDASTLNNKSIDFQLAHVFKSPGFKNEYLTRELISLITLIAEGKGKEELKSSKIEEILALKNMIDDDDPVKELIKMVESIKKEYS